MSGRPRRTAFHPRDEKMEDIFGALVRPGDVGYTAKSVVRVVGVQVDGELPPVTRTGAIFVSTDLAAKECGFVTTCPEGAKTVQASEVFANSDRCTVTVTEQQLRQYSQRTVQMLQILLKDVSEKVVETIALVQAKNLGRKTEALFAGKGSIADKTFIQVQQLANRFGKSSCDPFKRANSGQMVITTQKKQSVETSVGQLNCICGLVEIGIDFAELVKKKNNKRTEKAKDFFSISLTPFVLQLY